MILHLVFSYPCRKTWVMTSERERWKKRGILTIATPYHPFQSSHENQTHTNTHTHTYFLPFVSLRTFIPMSSYSIGQPRIERMGPFLFSPLVAHVLLLFVRLFSSSIFSVRLSCCLNSHKASLMMITVMTNKERQQLSFRVILHQSRSRICDSDAYHHAGE